jgi:hypothetical protein
VDKAFLIVASSKLTIKLVKDMSMEEIQSGPARLFNIDDMKPEVTSSLLL